MKKFAQQKRGTPLFHFLIFTACITAFSPQLVAERSPRYSVIPLGTPGTDHAWSENFMYPEYINKKGDIVGQRGSGVVLYRDGTIYELGYPREPLENGWTSAINDRGEILGVAFAESSVSFVLQSLPRPLLVADARNLPVPAFVAMDVNNGGTIIGYIYNRQDDTITPVVYHDGRITELPSLFPGRYASPFSINDRGQILGQAAFHDGVDRPNGAPGLRAVIWSGGRLKNLGVLPGFHDSHGASINDRGEAVGHCYGPEGFGGFIYRHGVMRPLPSPPGARHTFATRINNAGDVLVHVIPWRENDEASVPYDSFWLYADGALHDLTAMVAWPSRWRVQALYLSDINDRGEIVGVAHYLDRNHRFFTQGILLVPRNNGNRGRISRSDGPFIAPR